MDSKAILESLLGGGQTLLQQGSAQAGQAGQQLQRAANSNMDVLKGAGMGAAAAGAVALLLATREHANLPARHSSLAARQLWVGWLTKPTGTGRPNPPMWLQANIGTRVDELPAPEANIRSEAIVRGDDQCGQSRWAH